MVFSFAKWGDPLALPHRTFALNQTRPADLQPDLLYSLAVVPGSLFMSLTPVVLVLALLGVAWCIARGSQLERAWACLVVLLILGNCYGSVVQRATMARYTLMYSWLLLPLAFKGLEILGRRWAVFSKTGTFAAVLLFVLAWQVGIVLGAKYAPERIADKLAVMAPTLPLPVDLQKVVDEVKTYRKEGDAIIVDNFQYEATDIIRFSGIPRADALRVPYRRDNATIEASLRAFLETRQPRLLVYTPKGPLGRFLKLGDEESVTLPEYGMRVRRLWKGSHYALYEIDYNSGRKEPSWQATDDTRP
jgi:hypothetical protein